MTVLDPYEHGHSRVEEIPWSRLGGMLIQLAETVARDWRPEIVVGIAKGGVIPAVFLSSAFSVDFLPIKLSSRRNEKVVHQQPVWHVFPTPLVTGKKVLLVDDICVAGRTLRLATEEIMKLEAEEVRTATIAIHQQSVRPDYLVLESDALIVWPWDRDMLTPAGEWIINPEYLEEMAEVAGYDPGPSPAREPEGCWQKERR